jgi:hypothetical protein
MTEEEWLTGNDPTPMLEFLNGNTSDRKLRYFSAACCRMVWGSLTDEASRAAVTLSEQFADGRIDHKSLKKARRAAWEQWRSPKLLAAWHAADLSAWKGAFNTAHSIAPRYGDERDAQAKNSQCHLIRDIFGNPFRPVVADPAWLTPTVVAIAEAIYRDRAFDRLPILADALEEAGCTDADLLLHCRQPGEHVRGCWAVDLVLGKG